MQAISSRPPPDLCPRLDRVGCRDWFHQRALIAAPARVRSSLGRQQPAARSISFSSSFANRLLRQKSATNTRDARESSTQRHKEKSKAAKKTFAPLRKLCAFA